MWMVILPLVIPTIMIFSIVSNPNTTMAVTMSLIPFFSPIVMVVRLAATNVPLWQTLSSLALLIAAFLLAIWLSSRIYRVGILSYGKRPTFRELFRWIRQP
jgi:ABC-2 type transport system permease protein